MLENVIVLFIQTLLHQLQPSVYVSMMQRGWRLPRTSADARSKSHPLIIRSSTGRYTLSDSAAGKATAQSHAGKSRRIRLNGGSLWSLSIHQADAEGRRLMTTPPQMGPTLIILSPARCSLPIYRSTPIKAYPCTAGTQIHTRAIVCKNRKRWIVVQL